MAQAPTNHVSPLAALALRWKLATLLVVVGTGIGVGVGYLTPTTYTGEARVAVGSQSLDARIVSGYSLASEQLASDVARYVNDRQAQNDLTPVLGDEASSVERVAASPIADSSVILVEVDAKDADAATTGAQTIAQQLVDQVNATFTTSEDLLQQYTDISNQVQSAEQAAADAQGALASAVAAGAPAADVDAARAAVQQTGVTLDVVQVQQQALSTEYRNARTSTTSASGLTIVREAQVSSTDASSTVQRNALAGAGVGGLAALLIATMLERRRTGQRSPVGPTDANEGLDVRTPQDVNSTSTRNA